MQSVMNSFMYRFALLLLQLMLWGRLSLAGDKDDEGFVVAGYLPGKTDVNQPHMVPST